jgi:hypothetical protein
MRKYPDTQKTERSPQELNQGTGKKRENRELSHDELDKVSAGNNLRGAPNRDLKGRRVSLDDPSLPPVPVLLPFPRIVPRGRNLIAFRPAHDNGISLSG